MSLDNAPHWHYKAEDGTWGTIAYDEINDFEDNGEKLFLCIRTLEACFDAEYVSVLHPILPLSMLG